MTRRITISLPDDVADRLDEAPNASAFIASAVRHTVRGEQTAGMLASAGIEVTEEGRERARQRLREARERLRRPEVQAARLERLKAAGLGPGRL
jgi:metal-responsive CopG/Arc/MetJ family transcriptional regulator